jgi:diguanylate cyclase (GGDEF)-like protein
MSLQPTATGQPVLAETEARLEAARQALLDGRYADVERLGLDLVADCQARGETRGEAEAALILARLFGNMRRRPESIQWGQRVLELGSSLDDRALGASGWAVQASALAEDDRPAEAVLAVDAAIRFVDPGMPALTRRLVYTCLLLSYRALGMFEQALEASRQALAVSETDALRFWSLFNHCTTGLDAMDQAAWLNGVESHRLRSELLGHEPELATLARSLGTPFARMRFCEFAGGLFARLGRLAEARELLSEAAVGQPNATLVARRDVQLRLAAVLKQLGEAEAARQCADEALVLSTQIAAPHASRELLRRCELHALRDEFEQAFELGRQHYAKTVHVLLSAMNAQIADLSARVSDQAMRLENAELRERNRGLTHHVQEVRQQALTDGLTGVANRRGLEKAYRDLSDAGECFALAMLDVDHFKRVNDEFSHMVGDIVLRQCSQLMAESLRAPDCLARYGGEEFTVLLAEQQTGAALAVIERLHQRIQSHDWSRHAPGLVITLSAGLVMVAPGEAFEHAIARADAKLYGAKRAGRNRIDA